MDSLWTGKQRQPDFNFVRYATVIVVGLHPTEATPSPAIRADSPITGGWLLDRKLTAQLYAIRTLKFVCAVVNA